MNLMGIYDKIRLLVAEVASRETSLLGRQKLAVYMYFSLILILGICCNLLGATGPDSVFFIWLNSIHLVITLLILSAYLVRRIPLTTALCVLTVVTQLEISAEMVYCALHPSLYHNTLIVGNMVLLGVLIMFALVAYMKYFPYLLGTISIGSYTLCVCITKSPLLMNFLLIYVLMFAVICMLGHKMVQIFRHLDSENEMLRREEQELFQFLDTNRDEIRTFIDLSRNKLTDWKKTESLLDYLQEEKRLAILENVMAYRLQQETEMQVIDEAFADLSPSEKEVCRLILQGKKLTEICSALGKTETNINSTRAHIRKKLGLQPADNLYKALQQRQKEYMECRDSRMPA